MKTTIIIVLAMATFMISCGLIPEYKTKENKELSAEETAQKWCENNNAVKDAEVKLSMRQEN